MPDDDMNPHTIRMQGIRARVQRVARAWNVTELDAACHVISYLHHALERAGIAVPLDEMGNTDPELRPTDPLPPRGGA